MWEESLKIYYVDKFGMWMCLGSIVLVVVIEVQTLTLWAAPFPRQEILNCLRVEKAT